jgi:RNA polymerase sigma-70 factor (ECF subfamily)
MNTYATYSDRELTDRLNDRDQLAYAEIYNRYWKVMHETARKLVLDSDQAKDIVQDSFVNLYNHVGKTDFRQIEIAAYLHRIVRNTFLNLTLRDKRKATYMASLRDFANAGEFITDHKVREKEVHRLIEKEIARLPNKMRAVFEMSRKQYMTHKEIAEASKLTEETVKSHIVRAIRILKARLGAHIFLLVMAGILCINRIL